MKASAPFLNTPNKHTCRYGQILRTRICASQFLCATYMNTAICMRVVLVHSRCGI